MSRLRLGGAAAVAGLALAAFAAAPAVAAAGPAGFSLSSAAGSGAIAVRAQPGTVARGAVRVENRSRRAISVRLQAADIANGASGGADFKTRATGTGRWIELAREDVRVAPRSSRQVAYTVRVPRDARGGSYYGGIVAIDRADLAPAPAAKAAAGKQRVTVQRVNRMAVPLTVRLPGTPEHALELDGVDFDVQSVGAALSLALRPGGNELMQGARVRMRVMRGGRTAFTHDGSLGQLFPGSGFHYRIPWHGQPVKGEYRVVGAITPEGAAAVPIDQTVDFSPAKAKELKERGIPSPAASAGTPSWVWLALAGALVLVLVLPLAAWKLARRTRSTA